MTIIQPVDPDDVWFETSLLEEKESEERDERRSGTRFSFGRPIAYNLETLYAGVNRSLGSEIRQQLSHYEFWLLRLVCTLHPKPHSAVHWFEFHIAFEDTPSLSADPADPPIAYSLHPNKVEDSVAVSETIEIAPSLEFQGVVASIGKAGVEMKYKTFHPKITAFGERQSHCYWRFTTGVSDKVQEGDKEMDVIVRKRRGTAVLARISAEGKGQIWGFIPAKLKQDGILHRFGD